MSNPGNERYAGETTFYGTEPNTFLVEQAPRLAPGSQVLYLHHGPSAVAVNFGLAALLLFAPVRAIATVSNTAIWNAAVFQGSISGRWGFWFEQGLRLSDGWSADPSAKDSSPDSLKTRGNRWILRPALTWSPESAPQLTLHFGAAWMPNLSPVRGDVRLWQQLTYAHAFNGRSLSHRVRFEQRHVERTEGVSLRGRYQLRLTREKIAGSPWGWVLWDELFFNFNDVPRSAVAGYEQNRLFLGPQRQLADGARLEVGYLLIHATQGAARDAQINHVGGLFFFFDLDAGARTAH